MDTGAAGTLGWLFGSGAHTGAHDLVTFCIRSVVVFGFAWGIVRVPGKRFLGKYAAFDFILIIVLGSTLSRAINGRAPLVETLAACGVLVILHWSLAALAFRSSAFNRLFGGTAARLVENGEIRWKAMHRNYITRTDLEEALRSSAKTENLGRVQVAILERNGEISVLPRTGEPRVVETAVEAGVQKIRIVIE